MEDQTPVGRHPPRQLDIATRITPEMRDSVARSITEYKKRCARDGICHNDEKPCKHYRSCVLSRCEACLLYTPQKGRGTSSASCVVCIFYPGDGKLCKDFSCMVAGKGR